jgi:hypothetical protein
MKFETGKTYYTRSAVDYDTIIAITIIKRTAKTITTKTMGRVVNLRVKEFDGVETVRPWGSYSMCPTIGADRIASQ